MDNTPIMNDSCNIIVLMNFITGVLFLDLVKIRIKSQIRRLATVKTGRYPKSQMSREKLYSNVKKVLF